MHRHTHSLTRATCPMRTAGTSRTPRTWRTGRRRTGSVPILAAVLVLVPLAAACGEEQADGRRPGSASVSAEPPLTGVRWAVDSVTVDGATRRSPGSARLTIADGKASGSYGCNDFTATAVVEGAASGSATPERPGWPAQGRSWRSSDCWPAPSPTGC